MGSEDLEAVEWLFRGSHYHTLDQDGYLIRVRNKRRFVYKSTWDQGGKNRNRDPSRMAFQMLIVVSINFIP